MTMLATDRLEELLGAFPARTVTVIGDFPLDRYCWADVQGFSRERADPVHSVWRHTFNPGGSGNTSCNLAALGGGVRAVTVTGDDPFASILTGCLSRAGCDASRCLPSPTRQTTSFEKTRSWDKDGKVQDISLYVDNRAPLTEDDESRLLAALDDALAGSDALIVADYSHGPLGVVSQPIRAALRERFASFPGASFAMSRHRLQSFAGSILTGNEYECSRASGLLEPELFDEVDLPTLARVARVLGDLSQQPGVVTCGWRGMIVWDGETAMHVPTAAAREEIDPVGAGDSALAAMALAIASGASLLEAAWLGNMAANVTIHKIHTTGTASPEEMREVARRFEGLEARALPLA